MCPRTLNIITYLLPNNLQDMHAIDVMQTCFAMCFDGHLDNQLHLDGIQTLSFLFSALIHDFKHPGFNTNFIINSNDKISLLYNGIYIQFNP